MRKRFAAGFLAAALLLFAVPAWAELERPLQTGEDFYTRFAGQGISINVYNWGEYISNGADGSVDVNREFTALTGIQVYYSNYATNEELYSKLRSGSASYDVVIPSDYMIGRLISEGMLEELEFSNLPNFENIGDEFLDPIYDPGNRYSVPYTWGVVGIIYNTELVDEVDEVDTWEILWNEKYLGSILMFANSRDAFGIAQKKLGYSMNTTDSRELAHCLEELKRQKPLVQSYVMDEIFDKMLGGEAALAPYYAGDALMMMEENEDLDFAVPREGTNIFVDAACIPKGSRQKEAAELYINFLLEPEIGAANADFIGYATPNTRAMELLDPEVLENPIAYPPPEVTGNGEFFNELPREASLEMDRMWTELLTADTRYNQMLMPVLLALAVLLLIGINVYRSQKKKKKAY